MINWFREKLSEKRTRWRKQHPNVNSESRDRDNRLENAEKKQKLFVKNNSDDSILPNKISLKIINPRGGICTISVQLDATGINMKKEAFRKLSEDSNSHFSEDGERTLEKYKMIRAKTQRTLDDKDRIDELKVTENEEFVLVAQRTDSHSLLVNEKGPSENEILEATRHLPVQFPRSSPVNQINSAFMQNELQYDFRKILLKLLYHSAYLIGGSNTQSKKLIEYFHQKLRHKIKPVAVSDFSNKKEASEVTKNIEKLLEIVQICSQSDTATSRESISNMVDMGFAIERVEHAMRMTKNNENEACELLLGGSSSSVSSSSQDLPIVQTLLSQPQIQFSLGNPKMFIAYISILENYLTLNCYLNDPDTSTVITHILRLYHEEKHILAINQSNAELL